MPLTQRPRNPQKKKRLATNRCARSFRGCHTCRKRRVKCDERQPSCNQCKGAGFVCGGYTKHIFFDFEQSDDRNVSRFRRPLLTESERKRMSEQLSSTCKEIALETLLNQLDDRCENGDLFATNVHLFEGPFGAFRFTPGEGSNAVSTDCPARMSPKSDVAGLDEADHGKDSTLEVQADLEHPQLDALASFMAIGEQAPGCTHFTEDEVNSDGISSYFPSSMTDLSMFSRLLTPTTAANMIEVEREDALITTYPDTSQIDEINGSALSVRFENIIDEEEIVDDAERCDNLSVNNWKMACLPQLLSFPMISNNTQQQQLLSHAVLLLRHYGDSVVSCMSPHKREDTPWQRLFVPQLKNCYATLAFGENLDVASLAMFYGAVAVSALSLGVIQQSSMWQDCSKVYRDQCYFHARLMLHNLYKDENQFGANETQYTKPLMALLTIAQVASFTGRSEHTEWFLVELEKLIRLRGLVRKKTRQVRMLHHCYVYMRMFHESTFVQRTQEEEDHRCQVRNVIEWSDAVGYNTDNLVFRLRSCKDLRQSMKLIKPQSEWFNDLHIEHPGLYPLSLYPELFGVSEAFMFLHSQVIRLANEKDASRSHVLPSAVTPMDLGNFMQRAKAIEEGINQLNQHEKQSSEKDPSEIYVVPDVLDGMKMALLIYFYRRIYDISAIMLQPHVLAVRDWLVSHTEASPDSLYGAFGYHWPAFVAASEAEGPELQASFADWFRKAALHSGVYCFVESLNVVQQVWQAKKTPGRENWSWLDVKRANMNSI